METGVKTEAIPPLGRTSPFQRLASLLFRIPFSLYIDSKSSSSFPRPVDLGIILFRDVRYLAACLSIAALISFPISVHAADPFYFGSWKVISATVAPWWPYVEPGAKTEKPDPSETKLLVGKMVVIGAKGIAGPRPVACSGTHYQVMEQPAEGLFQGMFSEMHEHDKSVDPRKVAASVGFRGSNWKTLETGCAVELDYHFLDPSTAAFGLNNYIYILKKQ